MRVAIIGGTGQIGVATASLLRQRGVETILVSRTKPAATLTTSDWVMADITDESSVLSALKEARPQRVLDLAALLQFACEQDPAAAIHVNVGGTLNVLEACRKLSVDRIVFGSSIAVYGERSDRMHEDDARLDNPSLYGLTKLLGEALGTRYEMTHGMRFLALRYSGVFGGHEAATSGMSLVRSKILRSALGSDVSIHEASGGEFIHLTHIGDAAEATCAALLSRNPSHAVYNIAGPHQNYMRLRDFHALLRQAVPGCGDVIWTGKARQAGLVDTSRLRKDLKFSPRITITKKLLRTFALEMQMQVEADTSNIVDIAQAKTGQQARDRNATGGRGKQKAALQ